jgi:hypothetical protein
METGHYTLDPELFDWPALLSRWKWLMPKPVTPLMVNRLGDLVIVNNDQTVSFFDIGRGRLNQIAASREEFDLLIEESKNSKEWLATPLVKKLLKQGLTFKAEDERIYGFKVPPLLGGEYEPENIEVTDMYSYYGFLGDLFSDMEELRAICPDQARFG